MEFSVHTGHHSLTRMTRLIDKYPRVPLSPLSRINLPFAERPSRGVPNSFGLLADSK
jgi:hypothetical protein